MLPEVKYSTPEADLSTIPPLFSVKAIELAIARLEGAKYWSGMGENLLTSIAVSGARQALAGQPQ
jgi:hypothetical protein